MLTVITHVLVSISVSAVAAVWPLAPRPEVVDGFAPPPSEWAAGHRGVDLLGSQGQSVRTAQEGTITFAGLLAGRGVVVVSHGETRTTYQPVTATVNVGDVVLAGQNIGALQTFGSHCWPRACLHWGLLEGDIYLNPLTLVGAGPVRLLPLYTDLPSTDGKGVLVLQSELLSPFAPWESMSPPSAAPSAWSSFARPAGAPVGRPGAGGLW